MAVATSLIMKQKNIIYERGSRLLDFKIAKLSFDETRRNRDMLDRMATPYLINYLFGAFASF